MERAQHLSATMNATWLICFKYSESLLTSMVLRNWTTDLVVGSQWRSKWHTVLSVMLEPSFLEKRCVAPQASNSKNESGIHFTSRSSCSEIVIKLGKLHFFNYLQCAVNAMGPEFG